MSSTILIIVCAAVVGGWSFLRVLGNERQRTIDARPKNPAETKPTGTGEVTR